MNAKPARRDSGERAGAAGHKRCTYPHYYLPASPLGGIPGPSLSLRAFLARNGLSTISFAFGEPLVFRIGRRTDDRGNARQMFGKKGGWRKSLICIGLLIGTRAVTLMEHARTTKPSFGLHLRCGSRPGPDTWWSVVWWHGMSLAAS